MVPVTTNQEKLLFSGSMSVGLQPTVDHLKISQNLIAGTHQSLTFRQTRRYQRTIMADLVLSWSLLMTHQYDKSHLKYIPAQKIHNNYFILMIIIQFTIKYKNNYWTFIQFTIGYHCCPRKNWNPLSNSKLIFPRRRWASMMALVRSPQASSHTPLLVAWE